MLAVVLGVACGGGPSRKEVERSMREFQLADALRNEGNTPASIEHLRKSLELDPENARAQLLMGFIFMERGDLITAEEHLRNGIRILQERSAHSGGVLAEARNVLGLALIHQKRYDEAIEVLERSAKDALNRAPHLAWGNLGLAHYEKKEYDAALRALRQAVRMQPRFCVGFFLMGQIHFDREDFEQAEKTLTKAIEADPKCKDTYQEAWKLRGEARARLGHRHDAIADFERCVEINPEAAAGKACQRLLESTE